MPYEEAAGYLHYRSRDGNLAGELALHKQRLSFDDLFYGEIREVSYWNDNNGEEHISGHIMEEDCLALRNKTPSFNEKDG